MKRIKRNIISNVEEKSSQGLNFPYSFANYPRPLKQMFNSVLFPLINDSNSDTTRFLQF